MTSCRPLPGGKGYHSTDWGPTGQTKELSNNSLSRAVIFLEFQCVRFFCKSAWAMCQDAKCNVSAPTFAVGPCALAAPHTMCMYYHIGAERRANFRSWHRVQHKIVRKSAYQYARASIIGCKVANGNLWDHLATGLAVWQLEFRTARNSHSYWSAQSMPPYYHSIVCAGKKNFARCARTV